MLSEPTLYLLPLASSGVMYNSSITCHPEIACPAIMQVLLKEGSKIGPPRTVPHRKDAAMATVEHTTLFSSSPFSQKCMNMEACMQFQTSKKTVHTMSFHMCARQIPSLFWSCVNPSRSSTSCSPASSQRQSCMSWHYSDLNLILAMQHTSWQNVMAYQILNE